MTLTIPLPNLPVALSIVAILLSVISVGLSLWLTIYFSRRHFALFSLLCTLIEQLASDLGRNDIAKAAHELEQKTQDIWKGTRGPAVNVKP